MKRAVGLTVEACGRLDYAVNYAGIAQPPANLSEISTETWSKILAVNAGGIFNAMRYEIPAMLATGGGAIVNIASTAASRGLAGMSGYSASKHAVLGLTRSAVLEYASKGLRINVISPGAIDTPMLGLDAATAVEFLTHVPQRRTRKAEDIATVAAFLLSNDASYVNRAEVLVDGGFLE